MIKKTLLTLILATIMILFYLPCKAAYCSAPIKVELDGQIVSLDVNPVTVDGRILVPARGVFQQMRAFVQWDPTSQTVLVVRNGIAVKLTVNSNTAYVNDRMVALDTPALIVNGRLMVPIRFISESFNADVSWDVNDNSVLIDDSNTSDMEPDMGYTDASNTALYCPGSGQFNITWKSQTVLPSDMAVDANGDVYFVDQYSTMRAIDANGKDLWSTPFDGTGVAYLTLGLDGTIYVVSEGTPDPANQSDQVFAFNKNGTAKWSTQINNPVTITGQNMFGGDQDGSFFIVTQDGIACYDRSGAVKWVNKDVSQGESLASLPFSNVDEMVVDQSGNTYINTSDILDANDNSPNSNQLFSLDPSGKIRWKCQGVQDGTSLYLNGESQLYYWDTMGLHVIDTNTGDATAPGNLVNYPSPESWSGGAYLANKQNGIIALDNQGDTRWSYSVPGGLNGQVQDLVTDASGNVYFVDNGGNIYSLDRSGNVRYIFLRNNDMISSSELLLSKNNELICLTNGLGVFAISNE